MDGGFVVGGLMAGLVADTWGFRATFIVISALNVLSALTVAGLMVEPSSNGRRRHGPPSESSEEISRKG
jgi:predicted MFS family arabinose efflux permease